MSLPAGRLVPGWAAGNCRKLLWGTTNPSEIEKGGKTASLAVVEFADARLQKPAADRYDPLAGACAVLLRFAVFGF